MKIVFTPDWFLSPDVIIEIFSFIVLIFFFLLCIKSYRLNKNKSSLWLGVGFFLIALAELSTISTKIVLYYDTIFTQNIGRMVVTYNFVKTVDLFYYVGFFFHKLLTLLGLYVIYRIPQKVRLSGDVFLAVCFLFISAIFGNTFYYIFHLTALILLVFITDNYYKVYKINKSENTKILLVAFSILTISHALFILSGFSMIYVISQFMQLVSYLILLFLVIKILKHGKEKKQNRYNIRYVANDSGKRREN